MVSVLDCGVSSTLTYATNSLATAFASTCARAGDSSVTVAPG
ncbi:MAG: hypothetical protein WKF47_05520 [Geodermatophilaceae bacterium]